MTFTNEEILASREFRLLNILIDNAADELRQTEEQIKFFCEEYIKQTRVGRVVSTRIAEEDSQDDIELGDTHGLDAIQRVQEQQQALIERIRYLKRVKLNLIDDYDFTKGDDTFQKAVFGE